MSAKYTFLAWSTPIENAPLKLALLQLANNSDDNGFSFYSISKMSNACGMSERTFMRKISDLEKMKMLKVERRANRPSLYTLIGDEMGVTLCHLQNPEVTESHPEVTESHLLGDRESPDLNSYPKSSPVSKDLLRENEKMLSNAFDIFYSAGLVKKSKVAAFKKFKSLVKEMKADPAEFAELISEDIKQRVALQQFGIDKLHPSTYLNQQRWTDEHETNNGQLTPNGKQSAAQRVAARNNAKYGQPSSGLGMAESCGDLRGTVDQGEWGGTIEHVDNGLELIESNPSEDWDQDVTNLGY